jgi:hypothetical protein
MSSNAFSKALIQYEKPLRGKSVTRYYSQSFQLETRLPWHNSPTSICDEPVYWPV